MVHHRRAAEATEVMVTAQANSTRSSTFLVTHFVQYCWAIIRAVFSFCDCFLCRWRYCWTTSSKYLIGSILPCLTTRRLHVFHLNWILAHLLSYSSPVRIHLLLAADFIIILFRVDHICPTWWLSHAGSGFWSSAFTPCCFHLQVHDCSK